MRPVSHTSLLVGMLIAAVNVGCSQTAEFGHATIPTGQWHGRGTFTAWETTRKSESDADPQTRVQDNIEGYETTLTIEERELFGEQALEMKIVSKRGKIFESEDSETRLYVLLFPVERKGDGSTLYAVGDLHYNPKEPPGYAKREDQIRRKMKIPSASCVKVNRSTCLHVHYFLPEDKADWAYKDTFVFTNRCVRKAGSYFASSKKKEDGKSQEKFSQITWSERLWPRR